MNYVKNSPKITVVTIAYNAASVLEKTILSVINQTYENIEYILIDGGSTDGSANIIKKYEDKFAYWVSEPDKGIYDAMNKGIDKATGEWINFMNAGDRFAGVNSVSDIFNTDIRLESDTGVVLGDSYRITNMGIRYWKSELFYETNKYLKNMGFSHQCAFTRSDLAKENPFDARFKISADFGMMYSLYKCGFRFIHVNKIVCIVDFHGGLSKTINPAISITECAIIQGLPLDGKFKLLRAYTTSIIYLRRYGGRILGWLRYRKNISPDASMLFR